MNESILETLNGNWGIAAAALAVICAIYLIHEGIAYRVFGRGWRDRLTRSMRIMSGVLAVSVGVGISSIEKARWRMFGGDIHNLSKTWLLIGGVLALVGFLCLVREISKPLYGNGPWIWTLVAMACYTAGSIALQVLGG